MKKMIKINGGHTNKSFKIKSNLKSIFYQEWINDEHNHKINLNILSKFNFVPKLLEQGSNYTKWEFIEGIVPKKNLDFIKKVALILQELHNSKLPFPKSNYENRFWQYKKNLHGKEVSNEIKKYEKLAISVIKTLESNVPVHNDPWLLNFIKGKRLYLIDWEYASMGDKHFDLAYFIDASNLNEEEINLFLETYGNVDEKKLTRNRFLVNYFTLMWLNRHKKWPWDGKQIVKNVIKFAKLIR